MITKFIFPIIFILGSMVLAQTQSLSGKITDRNRNPVENTTILIEGTDLIGYTDQSGNYKISGIPRGTHTVTIELPNSQIINETVLIENQDVIFNYRYQGVFELEGIEIFGKSDRKQRGIEQITRFPVNTNEQIQTVSVISEKLIFNQGSLTLTDAAKNVPGVTQFASYGGVRESMSIRGYRGTPTLKNGVRMDSDFRTASAITDIAGVESVQIIRGSAAITQGIGNDLGSAGGVINIVTKTPNFRNDAIIGVRSGSWWRTRAQYDAQTLIDGENQDFGFRLTGAYEAGHSFRDVVKNEKVYVNPSFAWRPDDKTEVILEMDYLNQNTTPDRGTVNLAPDTEFALYKMGSKFTGFKDDNVEATNYTYSARVYRKISKKLETRVGFFNSYFDMDTRGATLAQFKNEEGEIIYNKRNRGLSRNYRNDRNSTLQIDLMGQDFKWNGLEWAWQVGYDYTQSRVDTRNAKGIKKLDVIDVLETIENPNSADLSNYDATAMELGESLLTKGFYYGFMTQHHITFKDYFKIIGGVRWSYSISQSESVVDPMIGFMVTPTKNISLFGSYTTTSSLRQADNPMENGETIGVSTTKQYEVGIKSQWFNDRFRVNTTYFDMNDDNLAYQIYDEDSNPTGMYGRAGNLRRKGVEFEVAGRPAKSLHLMMGYAYLDAKHHDSPAFMEGSRPANAPMHTGNAWAFYEFNDNFLKGFSIGSGVYYVGARAANEFTKITSIHNTTPGVEYFDMPAFTTLNVQLAYNWKKFNFQLFLNNITSSLGYNAYYRGGFINEIDPFDISAQINFKF